MKFSIYGYEFTQLIKRISGVVPKKSSFPPLEFVRIIANENTVEVQGTDSDELGSIKVPAEVFESGETWVYLSDLKKLTTIMDDVIITANDGIMDIRSQKKSYELLCRDLHDAWTYNPKVESGTLQCKIKEIDLINHLSVLDCMRADEYNFALKDFYFDLPRKNIVAMNNHRIGVARLDCDIDEENANGMIIHGGVYAKLKSLAGKPRKDNYVDIFADEKFVLFRGEDYSLISRLEDGQYFKYYDFLVNVMRNMDYCYSIIPEEMQRISKEYAKIIGKEENPMIICNENGNIATAIQTPEYRTSDIVESVKSMFGMEEEWYAGFNPHYIADACNMYKGHVEINGSYSNKKPILFHGHLYDCLVLPVSIQEKDVEFVKKQVA